MKTFILNKVQKMSVRTELLLSTGARVLFEDFTVIKAPVMNLCGDSTQKMSQNARIVQIIVAN
jgi:hypothetical protein